MWGFAGEKKKKKKKKLRRRNNTTRMAVGMQIAECGPFVQRQWWHYGDVVLTSRRHSNVADSERQIAFFAREKIAYANRPARKRGFSFVKFALRDLSDEMNLRVLRVFQARVTLLTFPRFPVRWSLEILLGPPMSPWVFLSEFVIKLFKAPPAPWYACSRARESRIPM